MHILRRAAFSLFLVGLLPAATGLARTDSDTDAGAAMVQELKTLKGYGAAHVKSCEGWTDGCAICVRRADGTLGCSRLGVACDISAIQCTQRSRDPVTGKTPPAE